MKYTDQQGDEREISRAEMDAVYGALGVLMQHLQVEHVAEYFKRPEHDKEVYASFRRGVKTVQELLSHVAEIPD